MDLPRLRSRLIPVILLLAGGVLPVSAQTVSRTADGFDLPVAPPEAAGFYKSRGFRAGGHLGEDWVTDGGSAKGLGRPVYAIGNGLVVLARDIHVAWGNVVVIRHAWIENRQLRFADSLYAHLDRITVREGQQVKRGQQVGTIGTNHGMYPPHLHFEIHKDLTIGVNHAGGTRDLRSYWLPTEFIMTRRKLGGGNHTVPTPAANFLLPTVDHPWSFHNPWSKKKKTAPKSSSKSRGGSRSASSHSKPSGSYKINRYSDP
jgi:murein DD-endopeptidase MepM/ murein hydrolase activator NlpD